MKPSKRLWIAIGIIILLIILMLKASLFIAWHALKYQNYVQGKSICTERSEFCTEEYNPVCGWFNKNIQCIKYPCAQTYSNSCFACADSKVKYWTQGSC